MRYLIPLFLVLLSCEKDVAFDLKELNEPSLDSIVARASYVEHTDVRLFGRSSGLRDMPVRLFFYAPDSAKDFQVFRNSEEQEETFRLVNFDIETTNNFWVEFLHPLYEGEPHLIASYTNGDTLYLIQTHILKHWKQRSTSLNIRDIDSRNASNPYFEWFADERQSDSYLFAIANEQDQILSSVLTQNTSFRFYDVFGFYEAVGPEFTQPKLLENENYYLYVMGVDTQSAWVNSYARQKFLNSPE